MTAGAPCLPVEEPVEDAADDESAEDATHDVTAGAAPSAAPAGLTPALLAAPLPVRLRPRRVDVTLGELQRLAREGLVLILPRKGILVAPADPEKQLLVLEVRRELERLLCRSAAKRATPEQLGRLRDIAKGMDIAAKANDDLAFMRLDRDLNLLVIEAAHNEYASRAMRLLQGLSRRFWYQHYQTAADLPHCARLHAAQARAIADRHPDQAAQACDALMDYVETFTRVAAEV